MHSCKNARRVSVHVKLPSNYVRKNAVVLTVFKTQENTIRQVKGFATVYVIYVHHSQSQITMLNSDEDTTALN